MASIGLSTKNAVLSSALANAALLIAAPSLGCLTRYTKALTDLCITYGLPVPDLAHVLEQGLPVISQTTDISVKPDKYQKRAHGTTGEFQHHHTQQYEMDSEPDFPVINHIYENPAIHQIVGAQTASALYLPNQSQLNRIENTEECNTHAQPNINIDATKLSWRSPIVIAPLHDSMTNLTPPATTIMTKPSGCQESPHSTTVDLQNRNNQQYEVTTKHEPPDIKIEYENFEFNHPSVPHIELEEYTPAQSITDGDDTDPMRKSPQVSSPTQESNFTNNISLSKGNQEKHLILLIEGTRQGTDMIIEQPMGFAYSKVPEKHQRHQRHQGQLWKCSRRTGTGCRAHIQTEIDYRNVGDKHRIHAIKEVERHTCEPNFNLLDELIRKRILRIPALPSKHKLLFVKQKKKLLFVKQKKDFGNIK